VGGVSGVSFRGSSRMLTPEASKLLILRSLFEDQNPGTAGCCRTAAARCTLVADAGTGNSITLGGQVDILIDMRDSARTAALLAFIIQK
jgi:hypothetical protein